MELKRLVLGSILALSIAVPVFFETCVASSNGATMVYVDPPWNSAPPGTYFTVNIKVAQVTNLNSWFVSLFFRQIVLDTNETMIEEGPFLSNNGVYPTIMTTNKDQLYWHIGSHIVGTESVSGSGTLVSITFKVLQDGDSTLALTETILLDFEGITINHTARLINGGAGYFNSEKVEVVNEVEVDGRNFTVEVTSNSSVSPVPFNLDVGQKEISFDVISPNGLTRYCNVSIPKSFMNCTLLDDWEVTVGGNPPESLVLTENSTHTFVYFTYTTSTHNVRISSTNIVPEFQPFVFLQLFIIATAAVTFFAKKRLSR